jgi:hypothetical protein
MSLFNCTVQSHCLTSFVSRMSSKFTDWIRYVFIQNILLLLCYWLPPDQQYKRLACQTAGCHDRRWNPLLAAWLCDLLNTCKNLLKVLSGAQSSAQVGRHTLLARIPQPCWRCVAISSSSNSRCSKGPAGPWLTLPILPIWMFYNLNNNFCLTLELLSAHWCNFCAMSQLIQGHNPTPHPTKTTAEVIGSLLHSIR